MGVVDPAALCPAATSGCPACSTDEGGACHDLYYAHAIRCGGGTDEQCTLRGGTCDTGLCVLRDDDHDGVDDDLEAEVAARNLPAVHMHPEEGCGTPRGIVYRVRRHPDRPERLAITYVVLYQVDCGPLNGHLGDNEAFAITVDLGARPGGAATVGVIADAHRHTSCESISTCETRAGTSACARDGSDEPRVAIYSSRDKHANYLDPGVCESNCYDACAAGPVDDSLVLVDAGAADAPLCTDLSAGAGALIVPGAGWSPSLLHFDPWSTGDFGGAGNIRNQLETLIAPAGL
jgi:hypothetical protein